MHSQNYLKFKFKLDIFTKEEENRVKTNKKDLFSKELKEEKKTKRNSESLMNAVVEMNIHRQIIQYNLILK